MTWAPLLRLQEALGPDAELVIVGGAVRDELLGRPHADWDLATRLLPEAVMARSRAAGLKVVPTGLKHGTVTVILEDRPVEVTTFRSDGDYLDGRRPESVRLGVTLEEDLSRRDFTINAMALPVGGDALVDPFGGRADLAARRIRAVGDPLQRFAEDGLRPLRACRFAAQLDFTVDPRTLAAIPQRLEVAAKVAPERVFHELDKLLRGQAPDRGLELLEACGLLDLWLPELRPVVARSGTAPAGPGSWARTLAVVREAPAASEPRWAALMCEAGTHPDPASVLETAAAVLDRLRASHALRKGASALIRRHATIPDDGWGDADCRRFLQALAQDGLDLQAWGAFREACLRGSGAEAGQGEAGHRSLMGRLERLAAEATALTVRDLVLDGGALMRLAGRHGGPWLGALQARLLEAVIEDPAANTPERLTELARSYLA